MKALKDYLKISIQCYSNFGMLYSEGGILILEAQPWKSYKKKIKLEKIYKQNYEKISHKP